MPGRPSKNRAVPEKISPRRAAQRPASSWTFLSNHGHVLLCLAANPELTLREVAQRVGITERSVQRILADVEEAGYVRRVRVSGRNQYVIRRSRPLRHPLEKHRQIGDLMDMVLGG